MMNGKRMMKHRNAVYVLCILLATLMLFAAGCSAKQAEETESKTVSEQISDVQSIAEADCRVLRIIDAESVSAVLKREPIRQLQCSSELYSESLVAVMERAAEDELIEVVILPGDFREYPYLYQDLCEDSYLYLTPEGINETAMRTVAGSEVVDQYVQIAQEEDGEAFLWDYHCCERLIRAGMPITEPEGEYVDDAWKSLVIDMENEQREHREWQTREWVRYSSYLKCAKASLEALIWDRGGNIPEPGVMGSGIRARLTVEELLEVGQLKWLQQRSEDSPRNAIEIASYG